MSSSHRGKEYTIEASDVWCQGHENNIDECELGRPVSCTHGNDVIIACSATAFNGIKSEFGVAFPPAKNNKKCKIAPEKPKAILPT